MKKEWFIILMLSVLQNALSGQDVIKMSEKALWEEAGNWDQRDTNRRVDVLNELVFRNLNQNNRRDTIWDWAGEAYKLAIAQNYLTGQGDALVRFGLLEERGGRLDSAVIHYHQALRIRKDLLQEYAQAARVCNNLGLVYKKQKDSLRQAIDIYYQGLDLFGREPILNESDKRSKARLMNNLGNLLGVTGNYNKAMVFLDSSLLMRTALADTVGMANSLLNLGLLYKRMGNSELWKDNMDKSLELSQRKNYAIGTAKSLLGIGDHHINQGNFTRAIDYYQKALSYSNHLDLDDLATIYQNKGVAHLGLGQLAEVEKNYEEGMGLFKKANDENGQALLYFNYAEFFRDQKKYPLAIEQYRKSLTLSGALPDKLTQVNLLYYLGDIYSKLGMPDSALKYTTQYLQLKDSISHSFQEAMNNKLNLEASRREVQELKLVQAEENQKKMKTYGLIAFGVTWLLLGLALMGYYINRQRRRLAEQGEELSQQKVIELMQEKELETNYAWINGVETTRRKIGQELHDDIGNMLSIVKVHFSSIEEKMDHIREESREQYNKANSLLDEACEKVRQLSHDMTSAILVKFGLKNQLESLAQTLKESGKFEVELSTYGLKERLATQTEFNIYRIIQELVTNVIRHARAGKLSIQVNRFDEMINLMVEDNGAGFDLQKAKARGGIGMKNVAARVHDLEGTINIDTAPGKGTSIAIDIPIFADEPLTLKD